MTDETRKVQVLSRDAKKIFAIQFTNHASALEITRELLAMYDDTNVIVRHVEDLRSRKVDLEILVYPDTNREARVVVHCSNWVVFKDFTPNGFDSLNDKRFHELWVVNSQ